MQDQEYQSYLLRCWVERQMDEGQSAVWRYSLEEPGTGRRYGFASLVALIAFLSKEMGRSSSGGESRINRAF